MNIRDRETLGDTEELMEKMNSELIEEHGEQWFNDAYASGELDKLYESIPTDYCNGKKVIEIQDGQFLLGENLICLDDSLEIKFLKSQENQIEALIKKFINNFYRSSQINELHLIESVKKYIK